MPCIQNRLVGVTIGCLLLLAGCNGDSGEKVYPVKGKLTVDDKPVPTGNVTFYPDAQKDNKSPHLPTGVIDAQGNYELFVPGGRKGAPLGWYKVVIYSVDDPQPMKPNKYFVNADYASVETTPVRVEVIADPEAGRYDLKLKK
jgi:hypothetical protein